MDPIVRYVFEAGMLKRVARSGWWAENVKHPESVADHSFRTALVAFILDIHLSLKALRLELGDEPPRHSRESAEG